MRHITYLILIILIISVLPLFVGCDKLETDVGSIAGAVFYSDGKTRVFGAWVRIYSSIEDPPVIFAEIPVDEQARYFTTLPGGQYWIGASDKRDGIYHVKIDPINIVNGQSMILFLSINIPPPSGN